MAWSDRVSVFIPCVAPVGTSARWANDSLPIHYEFYPRSEYLDIGFVRM